MRRKEQTYQRAHWNALWAHSWMFGGVLFFSFLVAILSLALPFFMLLVYDRVLNARSLETLTALAILASMLIVGMGVLDYSRRRLLARYAAAFQQELEGQLIALPPRSTTINSRGSLGLSELDKLRQFVHSGSLLNVIDVFWLPVYFSIVFIMNPLIGWLAFIGILLLGATFFLGLGFSASRRHAAKMTSQDATQAIKTLERSGCWLGGQNLDIFAGDWLIGKRSHARVAAIRANDYTVATTVILSSIRWIFAILVISGGVTLVLSNKLTIGGMVASVVLLNRVFFPFIIFLKILPDLKKAIDSWNRIGSILNMQTNTASLVAIENQCTPILELRDVTIAGDLTGEKIIKEINLKIMPSMVVQILGEPNSGKSILCDTLAWARRPAQGLILASGYRYSLLQPSQVAGQIGYVRELPLFLAGTIAQNISGLEHFGHSLSIEATARISSLHSYVSMLPDGYETLIDEMGSPLSRGNRELLALARALYHQPRLLIVDQPSDTLVQIFSNEGAGELLGFLQSGGSLILVGREEINLNVNSIIYRIKKNRLVYTKLNENRRPEPLVVP